MSAANPFIGEIYMFAGNFAPVGWGLFAMVRCCPSANTSLCLP